MEYKCRMECPRNLEIVELVTKHNPNQLLFLVQIETSVVKTFPFNTRSPEEFRTKILAC